MWNLISGNRWLLLGGSMLILILFAVSAQTLFGEQQGKTAPFVQGESIDLTSAPKSTWISNTIACKAGNSNVEVVLKWRMLDVSEGNKVVVPWSDYLGWRGNPSYVAICGADDTVLLGLTFYQWAWTPPTHSKDHYYAAQAAWYEVERDFFTDGSDNYRFIGSDTYQFLVKVGGDSGPTVLCYHGDVRNIVKCPNAPEVHKTWEVCLWANPNIPSTAQWVQQSASCPQDDDPPPPPPPNTGCKYANPPCPTGETCNLAENVCYPVACEEGEQREACIDGFIAIEVCQDGEWAFLSSSENPCKDTGLTCDANETLKYNVTTGEPYCEPVPPEADAGLVLGIILAVIIVILAAVTLRRSKK